jgi:hypothetical protein
MRYNTNRTDDIRSVFLFRSDINSSVPSTVIAEYFHPKCRFHPALEQSHALAKEDTQQLVQEPELNKSRTRCSFSSGRPCLPSSTRQPRRSIPAGIEFKSYVLFWRPVSVEIPGSTIGGHGSLAESREQGAGGGVYIHLATLKARDFGAYTEDRFCLAFSAGIYCDTISLSTKDIPGWLLVESNITVPRSSTKDDHRPRKDYLAQDNNASSGRQKHLFIGIRRVLWTGRWSASETAATVHKQSGSGSTGPDLLSTTNRGDRGKGKLPLYSLPAFGVERDIAFTFPFC